MSCSLYGMCTHGKAWVVEANNQLLEVLGSNQRIEANDLDVTETFPQIELYSHEFDLLGNKLRTHAILWSPVTALVKKRLYCDRTDNRKKDELCEGIEAYQYERASLNKDLNEDLLDDCLADAVIYSGKTGKEIRRQVGDAIEYAVTP